MQQITPRKRIMQLRRKVRKDARAEKRRSAAVGFRKVVRSKRVRFLGFLFAFYAVFAAAVFAFAGWLFGPVTPGHVGMFVFTALAGWGIALGFRARYPASIHPKRRNDR